MKIDINKIIGAHVKYYDYLDVERFGTIIAIEPYKDDIVYVYIEDEDSDYNVHQDIVNNTEIRYAELRTSDEVYLDK